MEATLGISLYSYLYLQLANMLCLSFKFLCLLFNKIGKQKDRTGSAWKPRGVEGRQGRGERWHKPHVHIRINIETVKKEKKGNVLNLVTYKGGLQDNLKRITVIYKN
jgi:hypothetical protein